MIVIDDTLGKRLWDELVFIERVFRTVPKDSVNLEIIRGDIEKLLKEAKKNGVVE